MAAWWENFQDWRQGNRANLEGWLQENVADPLNYYLGPTGIPERVGAANEVFNPVVGMEDAGVLAEELYETGDTDLILPIATEMFGALAPAAAGKIVGGTGDDIANAVVDTLAGFSPGVETSAKVQGVKDAAGDFVADEAGAVNLPMLSGLKENLNDAAKVGGDDFNTALSDLNFALEEAFPGEVDTVVDGGLALDLVDDMGEKIAPGKFMQDKGILLDGDIKTPTAIWNDVLEGKADEFAMSDALEPIGPNQGTLEDHYSLMQIFGNDQAKYTEQMEWMGQKLSDEMGEGYSYVGNGNMETPDLETVGVLDMVEGPGGDFKHPNAGKVTMGDSLAGGASVEDAVAAAKKQSTLKALNDYDSGVTGPEEFVKSGVLPEGWNWSPEKGYTDADGKMAFISDWMEEQGIEFNSTKQKYDFKDPNTTDIQIDDDLVDIDFDVLDDLPTSGVTELPPTVDVGNLSTWLNKWVAKGYDNTGVEADIVNKFIVEGGGPDNLAKSGGLYELKKYLEDTGFLKDGKAADPYVNATGPTNAPFTMGEGTVDDGLYLNDFKPSETGPYLGGSASKGVYVGPDGNKYVVKGYGDNAMAQNEYAASGIMEAAGLKTPGHKLIDLGDELKGGAGVATKYDDTLIPFDRTNPEHIKKAQDDFALNAILGNWDSIGLDFDNTMFKPDGTPVMIDPGGALKRRAMGGVKDSSQWNGLVSEFDTMRDPSVNPSAYEVYGGMTDHQINKSIQKAYDGLITPDGSSLKPEVSKAIDNAYGPGTPEGEELKMMLQTRAYDAKVRQEQFKTVDDLWDDAEFKSIEELNGGSAAADEAHDAFAEAVAENIPGSQIDAAGTITHPEWGQQSAYDMARWFGLTDRPHAMFLAEDQVAKVANMGLDYLKKGEDVPLGIDGALRLHIARADPNIVFKPKKVNGYPALMNKTTGQDVTAMGYLQDIGFIDSFGEINTNGAWQANVGTVKDAGTKGVRKVSVPEYVKYARQVADAIRANPRDPNITPEMESGFTAQSADWVRKNPDQWPGNLDMSPDASMQRAETMGYTPLWHHKGGYEGPDLRTARERGSGYDFISTTTNPEFKWGGEEMTPYMGDIQRTASAETRQGARTMAKDLGAPDYLADKMGDAADDISFNIAMNDQSGYSAAAEKWNNELRDELQMLVDRGMITPDQQSFLDTWRRAITQRGYGPIESRSLVQHMKEMGYDSFHMREPDASSQIYHKSNPANAAQNMGVIKPQALRRAQRERPALFDPRLRNKRNEFFGIGAGGLMLPMLLDEEEQNGTGGV